MGMCLLLPQDGVWKGRGWAARHTEEPEYQSPTLYFQRSTSSVTIPWALSAIRLCCCRGRESGEAEVGVARDTTQNKWSYRYYLQPFTSTFFFLFFGFECIRVFCCHRRVRGGGGCSNAGQTPKQMTCPTLFSTIYYRCCFLCFECDRNCFVAAGESREAKTILTQGIGE